MILTELETWLKYSHSPHYPGDPKSQPEDIFSLRPHLTHEDKIDLFRSYLDTMESYLEQENQTKRGEAQEYRSWVRSETTKRIDKLKEDIKTGRISSDPEIVSRYKDEIFQDEYDLGDPEEYWLETVEEFADTFRKSFFINLYSFWESQLFPLCDSLRQYDGYSMLHLGEAREFKIEQAKHFLRKIGFPLDTKTWSDINCHRIIRNCFVHHSGNPGRMEKVDQAKLEGLLFSKKSSLALNGKEPEKYRDIFLNEREAVLIQEGKPQYLNKKSIIKAKDISFRKGDVVLSPAKVIATLKENVTLGKRNKTIDHNLLRAVQKDEKIIIRDGETVICRLREQPNFNNGDAVIMQKGENIIFRQKFIFSEFDEVTLRKDFCKTALETIEEYFYELLDTLASLDPVQKAN